MYVRTIVAIDDQQSHTYTAGNSAAVGPCLLHLKAGARHLMRSRFDDIANCAEPMSYANIYLHVCSRCVCTTIAV
jgi:hypothetical protein